MKKYIINLIIKFRILNNIICILIRIKNYNVKNKISLRSKKEIFDYKAISKPLNKYYPELIVDNNFFGIGYSIRKYCGLKKSLRAYIEHGYFFGSYVPEDEDNYWTSKIITFSEHRENYIKRKTKKEVVKIGPYIHYAKDYLTKEEFQKEKLEIGRTLLVFPAHAASGTTIDFDTQLLLSNIESIRVGFDTVVISLFWNQAQDTEIVNIYKSKGYKIFSAGHRYDWFFLSRLKSMIKLSDITMSNGVGTQIGYCIYLDKPHWIARQEIKEIAFNDIGAKNNDTYIEEEYKVVKEELKEVEQIFAEYSNYITVEQKTIVNKYWGLDEIKSKEVLTKLLEK